MFVSHLYVFFGEMSIRLITLQYCISPLGSVEEGEGGMIWENGIKTFIISYMK